MAHFQQLHFVEQLARHMAERWDDRRVVEIGAADVNGSIRPFFAGAHYTGVDLAPGPGVDLVGDGHDVAIETDSVDLAISCECFEHNPKWRETFQNMHRMTRPGGIVVVTCASRGRLEHGTTRTRPQESPGTVAVGWDYYRNLNRADFERDFDLPSMFETFAFYRNDVSKDLYFAGRKRGVAAAPLRLDLGRFGGELAAANTLVLTDRRRRTRDRLAGIKDFPMKCAERLPDPLFQSFAHRWARAENAVRRMLRRR